MHLKKLEIKKENLNFIQQVVDIWKNSLRTKEWFPNKNHICNGLRCSIINIPFSVYKDHICFSFFLKQPCTKNHNINTFIITIYDLHICEETGNYHICGLDECNEDTIENKDGSLICPITGLETGGIRICSPLVYIVEKPVLTRYTILDKLRENPESDFLNDLDDPLRSVSLMAKTDTPQIEPYLAYARRIIYQLLFSMKKNNIDLKTITNAKKSAKKQIDKYVKKCKNSGKPIFVNIFSTIVENENRNVEVANYYISNRIEQWKYIISYSRRCVAFWVMIKQKTGISLNYKEFVIAAFYLMKTGIIVNEIKILNPDLFLEKYLLETKNLSIFNLTTPTNMKKQIINAINKKIIKEYINPLDFKIDLIDIYSVSLNIFKPLPKSIINLIS